MKAYLHFGNSTNLPMQTVEVACKESCRPIKGRTTTGYGSAMPTDYLVFWANRWRRVYVANYGNMGTAYIGKPGAWIATVDINK